MDRLIVGLGNPGRKYAKSKHNIGYICVDAYADAEKLKFRKETKFLGETALISNVILLKPKTFMNLSGNSVKAVSDFYRIPVENILVISDDVDLPFGKIRLREKGGSGGHNGLKHIMSALGNDGFKRLRVGIGRDDSTEVKDHVLSDFSKAEIRELKDLTPTLIQIIDAYANGDDFVSIMNRFN
ncbi:MAG: aminoacyl-tRNA hydrolase [Bacilli bacterium]|nr:aminoacyl-tRNA hydrolase [Bacilli bacterium]MBN2696686.1 aminoacyl-tRNA hydrolase [Bacilli bacterium]